MTVLPFPTRSPAQDRASVPSRTAEVTGTFWSPGGPAGTFRGSYRLERFVDQYGQTAAAGIFTGELVGADGVRLGMGSRRHTAAADLVADPGAFVARLGPVDVNLLGFLVTVEEFTVTVARELPAPPAAMPATAGELLHQVATSGGRGRVSVLPGDAGQG